MSKLKMTTTAQTPCKETTITCEERNPALHSRAAFLGIAASAALLACLTGWSKENHQEPAFEDKFRQLEEILPTPNAYRNAAGQPGHAYWQQQVDYSIAATLDLSLIHISEPTRPY